jgi:hypothetical protein
MTTTVIAAFEKEANMLAQISLIPRVLRTSRPVVGDSRRVMSSLAVPLSLAIGRAMQTGGSVNDASSTHRLQLIAAGLAFLGLVLIGSTIWYWRATRPEHRALAPLEVMSDRKWRNADTGERRRTLDEVRAPDSPSLAPALAGSPPPEFGALAASRDLPPIDDHAGFGDLVEATVTPEREPAASDHPASVDVAAPAAPEPVPEAVPEPAVADETEAPALEAAEPNEPAQLANAEAVHADE